MKIRMKGNNNIVALFFLLASLLTGCEIRVPEKIIQPAEMESLLYDYHLAQAMVQSASGSEAYQKEAYYQFVFDKHKTSREEFDSSLVWYTRNPKYLSQIYESLSLRMQKENDLLTAQLQQSEGKSFMAVSGDTADIWYLNGTQWLWNVPLSNRLAFRITADTTFYPNDTFEWTLDSRFLRSVSGGESDTVSSFSGIVDGNGYMAMQLVFDNDSVLSRGIHLAGQGRHVLRIECDSAYALKELNGFVYLEQDTAENVKALLLQNIALNRYHRLTNSASSEKEE